MAGTEQRATKENECAKPILALAFLGLSFSGLLGALGADTTYDEPNYLGIARSLWHHGRPSITDEPGEPAFRDSPIAVPIVLAPIVGATHSIQAARIVHWILFVLPGLIAVAVILKQAGSLGATVGYLVLLLIPFNLSYAATHVNFDAALSSWGLIALCCFVSGRCTFLGLLAILIATLCKYQAIVLCAALFTFTLPHPASWKRLLTYGLVSGSAIITWLLFLRWYNGTSGLGHGTNRFEWSSIGLADLRRFVGLQPELLIPTVATALVGAINQRRQKIVAACTIYLVLTLAFNIATIRLPGGLDYYLTPAYLPLAVCAGFAFRGTQIPVGTALALMLAATAKNFVPIILPMAGYLALALATIGFVMRNRQSGKWMLIASLFTVVLPRALPLRTFALPDSDMQTLVADAGQGPLGTWEEPRWAWYANRKVIQAKWNHNWLAPESCLLSVGENDAADRDDPRLWHSFQDFIKEHYVVLKSKGVFRLMQKASSRSVRGSIRWKLPTRSS
jgi:hypothetical protein